MARHLLGFVIKSLDKSIENHGSNYDEAARHIRAALEESYGGAWCVLLSKDVIYLPEEFECINRELTFRENGKKSTIWVALACQEVDWHIKIEKHDLSDKVYHEFMVIIGQVLRLHWANPEIMCQLVRQTIVERQGGNWLVLMSDHGLDVSTSFRMKHFLKVDIDNMTMVVFRQEKKIETKKHCNECGSPERKAERVEQTAHWKDKKQKKDKAAPAKE